jgi:AcrR family transcriptional regulator
VPKILSAEDIQDFRAELCRVATERFARYGYDGVTMRQLADDLGCSPKTPYRYFKDKDEILAAVRADAFRRFADALEAEARLHAEPTARAHAVGQAYLDFALANPSAYRIMFDVHRAEDTGHPELAREAARARVFITRQAEDMAAVGLVEGDPRVVGYAMWAAVHGLVVLRLAGFLADEAGFRDLHAETMRLIARGARAGKTKGRKTGDGGRKR